MGFDISRRDLNDFVCDTLPHPEDGTTADVDAIVDDVIEAWPDLIGHHGTDADAVVDVTKSWRDLLHGPGKSETISHWVHGYICRTAPAPEKYRRMLSENVCMRNESIYWSIVGKHRVFPMEMSAAQLADATQTEIESWVVLPQNRVTACPDGTVTADITSSDSALRARCGELTRRANVQ